MTLVKSMTKYLATHLKSFHKRGVKRVTLEKRILGLFFTKKNIKIKPPKKEYLRCKVIRGHKRINRQIQRSTAPVRTLNKCAESNTFSMVIWEVMKKHYFSNEGELELVSKTESGPKTDGRSKRTAKEQASQNSYNSLFCREYFQSAAVRQSFFYYVEYLFSYLNPEDLCEKFDLRCCKNEHDGKCIQKWLILKKYLSYHMIEDLGLEPYLPIQEEDYFLPMLMDLENSDD
ncbi:unnamed protein product [Blepharisma stoltei]|uniref:Uncharacterized protein n=1 Tax=Blepharisma stoltei TaxID=1481888 RepID=A0AAU9J970_9CILI|nr:unnamed protein product [Blepharisma stoltei]